MAPGRSGGEADSKMSPKFSRRTAAKGKKAKLGVNSNGTKEKIALITPLSVFRNDFLKDFLEKNRNVPREERASVDAVFQAAVDMWKSLSDADKAPYVARSLVLRKQPTTYVKKNATSLPDFFGNLKM